MTLTGGFKVFAYDLNTNTRLCELSDATNLQFDSRMGDAGAISFQLNIQAPRVAQRVAPVLMYNGEPFAVYVELNGLIVWGGLAWTGSYQKTSGALYIGGKEFLSYFDQRVIAASYTAAEYPSGIDPAALIAKSINDAQNAGAGASIGVSVIGGTSSIPAIIPGYPRTQYTTVTKLIDDMLAINVPGYGGIDINQVCAYDINGNPSTQFQVSSPRAGRAAGNTGLIFDLDSCIDYWWPTDATAAGNTIIATGAGTGAAMPTAIVSAPGVPVGALGQAPRLDKVISFQSAQSQQQISAAASGAANMYGRPVVTPKVRVLTGGAQPLGSWIMGDDARIYTAKDERNPNGLDQYWRIVQHTVTVPEAGASFVDVTFNLPPVY